MTDPPPVPRVAILSWSDARFDSRTERVARSAIEAGYQVSVYARWEPGLPVDEGREGYRVVRVPFDLRQAFGPTRAAGRRRVAARGAAARGAAARGAAANGSAEPGVPSATGPGRLRRILRRLARLPVLRSARAALELVLLFPVRPLAWADALETVVEPAEIWHGMWAGSLPALDTLRRRHGGATIYDSRDVFLHARQFGRLPGVLVAPFRLLERRWARNVDAVVTVNESYARLLARTLGVRPAAIVRNTPERRAPSDEPAPDLIRERLGLPATTRVVLYQGRLMDGRGIEEGMEAILQVPDAVLVLLGFGRDRDEYAATAARIPYRDRVFVVDAVPPRDLLAWTASADVALMAIQPTTVNHRYTTPNKLWEALAAGTPIVASDLPGMAEVIRETGAGVLCDPTSPTSIAAAIRSLLVLAPRDLELIRRRALDAAGSRYNWEAQVTALLELYERLAPSRALHAASSRRRSAASP